MNTDKNSLSCEPPEGPARRPDLHFYVAHPAPEAAAKTGKVIVMIRSGIHAGEIEGKDTVLMLVRDMTVGKRFAVWLDHVIFVIVPVFTVDGHEYFSPFHRPSQNGPKSTGLRGNEDQPRRASPRNEVRRRRYRK